MKAILLSCTEKPITAAHVGHFRKMISTLGVGGIIGSHYILHSKTQLLQILDAEQPDIVFSAAYYTPGDADELTNIHKILEEMDIPYIGSDSDTLELVLSKAKLKDRWKSDGVPTPNYFQIRRSGTSVCGLDRMLGVNGFPYILKPDREGNSRGLSEDSIVFDQKSLELKLSCLLDQYDEVLVERYLGTNFDIREFTVAMIGNGNQMLLMPAEIVLLRERKIRIITTQDKERSFTRATPVYDHDLNEQLIQLAGQAFRVAGVRDYSRCDVIYANGQFYAIEINGQPIVPDKWFDACARGVGLDRLQYVNAIFLAGIIRNIEQGKANLIIPLEMKQILPKSILDVLLKPVNV